MIQLRQRRNLAWLALLALAVQILLSFGHGHEVSTGHGRADASYQSITCADVRDTGCDPRHPADHDHDCAICLVLALASTATPPALIDYVPPPAIDGPWFSPKAAVLAYRQRSGLFQARAPPSLPVCV